MLASHKKVIFPLKRVFLAESQCFPIKFQVLDWRNTSNVFFTYVQLTFMLHHRMQGFLLMGLTVRKAFHGHDFELSIERAAMKTQSISLLFEKQQICLLPPPNYAPAFFKSYTC